MLEFFDYFDYFADIKPYPAKKIFGENPHKKPDISISIPTYKRSRTLKEAIDSALNQLGSLNYEINVVDNNPERDDETEKLMNSYKGYKNISYFKNSKNLGMGGNWSRCYEVAKADWVCLLHDDDILKEDYLESMTKIIKNKDLDAIFTQMQPFNDFEDLPAINNSNDIKIKNLTIYDWFLFPSFTPSGHLIKKNVIFELGGFSAKYIAPDIFFAKLIDKNRSYITDKNKYLYYRKGINESTKMDSMNIVCDLNHNFRLEAWPKMGIPKLLIKKSLPYSDYLFEKGIKNFWNNNFKYHGLDKYSKKELKNSKNFYRLVDYYIRLKKRLKRKFMVI